MKPILKWNGGKSSEINVIYEHMPKEYNRFVELGMFETINDDE